MSVGIGGILSRHSLTNPCGITTAAQINQFQVPVRRPHRIGIRPAMRHLIMNGQERAPAWQHQRHLLDNT